MDEKQMDSLNGDDSKIAANEKDGVFAQQAGVSDSKTTVVRQKIGQIDIDEKKRILRERAKKLSQKRIVEDSDTEFLQVIRIQLS